MRKTAARAFAALAAVAALLTPAAASATADGPAHLQAGRSAADTVTAPRGVQRPASLLRSQHVVLVGIGGLRWSDLSPARTPGLWRLAAHGAIGSLVVSGVRQRTCPTDGWLTLNGAARAAVPQNPADPCPGVPAVVRERAGSGARPPLGGVAPSPARIPAMPALTAANLAYAPDWGLLASAPGTGGCATAVGPGAALALASRSGQVASYLPSASGLTGADLARCRLTVIDLGDLPSSPGARSAALGTADRALSSLPIPASTTLIVLSPGGATPHLRVLIVSGPAARTGLLTSASTRQAGLSLLTDVTPTILTRLGTPAPASATGVSLRTTPRSSLSVAVAFLASQDVAAQVYRSTLAPFYLVLGFGTAALLALAWALPWGRGEQRLRRRRAAVRGLALWAASVPAGTLAAGLAPWPAASHPAAVLYTLTAFWAAALAAGALAGPWRRDPLGPPGAVAAATLVVIAADLLTGTHLQLETPFGLSMLVAGRFYGLANNIVVIYAASGILCATWAGSALLRRGERVRALAVMAALAAFTVFVAAWPAYGAKVGGTIAMVPAFAVLLAAAGGARITWRRATLIAVSGLAVVVLVAVVSYLLPLAGPSDISGFVGRALHGGAGVILRRKVSSNLGSLAESPFVLVIPLVLAVSGLVLAWPARLRAGALIRACAREPLLRPALAAIWLAAVLGWFAEDSGVTVPAAGLPLVLPLAVAILVGLPEHAGEQAPAPAVAPAAGPERSPA